MMVSIATVTTVGGSYSKWLPEWTDGILSQRRRPERVVIVVNGDVEDPTQVDETERLLVEASFDVEVIRLPWTHNYGRARNIAVDAAGTVWAHHADVDDLFLPHALSDWQELQHKADVVGFGWKRAPGHPKGTRRRGYAEHQGEKSRLNPGPASGPSPFRRSFWHRRPYDDRLPGGWDTALWRGFGWLDARFVPTRRPVFLYRWHPDSVFQSRLAADDPEKVGERLWRMATVPPVDAAVVVPWRDRGDPDRRQAWAWLKQRWETLHPEWPVIEADCDGEWNKPQALNDTIRRLDCRVLVVADADCAADPDMLRQAVFDAQTRPWVVPHGPVWRMDQTSSRELYDSPPDVDLPDDPGLIRPAYRGFPGGGLFVIGRAQWDLAGGFDPGFRSWGAEDDAFALAADTILGGHVRYDTPLWHLYHHPGLRSKDPHWAANRDRLQTYRRVRKDRRAMLELTARSACPTS